MKNNINKTVSMLAVGGVAWLSSGCKTIVRENIISAIDTGVGATVAENKQTQLYELKAGYVRSQFFSIPTGKLVENTNPNTQLVTDTTGRTVNAQISNAANITPQVVAGIKAHTGLGELLLGMDIAENFAVGDIAVQSSAATAMYISKAETGTNAVAAAEAVKQISQNDYSKNVEGTAAPNYATKKLKSWVYDTNGKYIPANQKALQDWINTNNLTGLDITPFLYLKQFAGDRVNAANDLIK